MAYVLQMLIAEGNGNKTLEPVASSGKMIHIDSQDPTKLLDVITRSTDELKLNLLSSFHAHINKTLQEIEQTETSESDSQVVLAFYNNVVNGKFTLQSISKALIKKSEDQSECILAIRYTNHNQE